MLKAISIRVDEELLERGRVGAKLSGVSLTDLLTKGLIMVLDDIDKPVEVTGEAVYESDPVKPVKVKRRQIDIAPIVKSLLAGVKVKPTVSHHPCCACGVCKGE